MLILYIVGLACQQHSCNNLKSSSPNFNEEIEIIANFYSEHHEGTEKVNDILNMGKE